MQLQDMDKKIVRLHAPDYDNRCAPFAMLPAALDIAGGSEKGFAGSLPQREKKDIKVLLLIRYKGRGFKLPRLVYSDMCCNDREVFMEIYKEL